MSQMWIWIFAVIVTGEAVRALMGYRKLSSIRVSVPIMALVPMGNISPLYLSKAAFLERAAAEMDRGYVDALDRYGTVWMFILVLVLSLAAASVSERISEKILKIKN